MSGKRDGGDTVVLVVLAGVKDPSTCDCFCRVDNGKANEASYNLYEYIVASKKSRINTAKECPFRTVVKSSRHGA